MIDGVHVRELRKHADERGYLMEMLREDWPDVFRGIRQVYVSMNYPGVIRAWHYHKRQYDVFVCVTGMIQVPLYDAREGSATRGQTDEVFIGEDHPAAILIPPLVYHGYKTLGTVPSLLLNLPSELYDGTDEFRVPYDSPEIGYDWGVRIR